MSRISQNHCRDLARLNSRFLSTANTYRSVLRNFPTKNTYVKTAQEKWHKPFVPVMMSCWFQRRQFFRHIFLLCVKCYSQRGPGMLSNPRQNSRPLFISCLIQYISLFMYFCSGAVLTVAKASILSPCYYYLLLEKELLCAKRAKESVAKHQPNCVLHFSYTSISL